VQYKLLHENSGQRTYAVVLSSGDEVLASLKDFITSEKVHAAQLTAIGALSELVLMYFDWEKKEYQKLPVKEQVEVASLIGDVAEGPDGAPTLHKLVMCHHPNRASGGMPSEIAVAQRPT
jgi:predicted DNA-binding protein with PD1-like motif